MTTKTLLAALGVTLAAAAFAAGTAHGISVPGAHQLQIPPNTRSKILHHESPEWDSCEVRSQGKVIYCFNGSSTNMEVTRPSTAPDRLMVRLSFMAENCCGLVDIQAPFNLRTLRIAGHFRTVLCQFSRSECEAIRAKVDKAAHSSARYGTL
jgi:hypothetical protein